jgi:hypothetical protein
MSLCVPYSRSGCFGEEKNVLYLWGICIIIIIIIIINKPELNWIELNWIIIIIITDFTKFQRTLRWPALV